MGDFCYCAREPSSLHWRHVVWPLPARADLQQYQIRRFQPALRANAYAQPNFALVDTSHGERVARRRSDI